MSEEFYKDSKSDIVDQLNSINGTSITAESVTIGVVNGKRVIQGDGKKYSSSKEINVLPRNLGKAVNGLPLVITSTDIFSGTVKVKDLIGEVNKAVGTNISIDDITNGEDLIPARVTTEPALVVIFKGNRVSMVDFRVIFAVKEFNLSNWAKFNEYVTVPSRIEDGMTIYTYSPFNFTSANIQTDEYLTNAKLRIGAIGSPIFLLCLNDNDKIALSWDTNIHWIDSDIRDFTGAKKFFIFFTSNLGKDYYAIRINPEAPNGWEELLFKLQGRTTDSSKIDFLVDGHVSFLKKNTGKIVDPHTDHFVINEKDILVNNRHFTYNTRQEGQPDSDATTEGHSLLITGYVEAYKMAKRRGDTVKAATYLAAAEKYFASYIAAFYAGEAPPNVPGRWSANWIVNGKNPVLAHYPLAAEADFPTHGGFKDKPLVVTNGQGQIAHGAPYWGEYLDVVGKVYEGKMGWDTINARPYEVDAEGQIDFDKPGKVYDIESVHTWSMEIISGDGNKIGTFDDTSLIGTILLKDKTVTGTLSVSFAPRLPVEHGGYLIQTNECQHNRPIQVPVPTYFKGNASDAEQWFCECAYDLWKITGKDLYKKSFKASVWTIMEYTAIDANDRFIRRVIGDARYDTDGITYYFTYPSNQPVTISRNPEGYIMVQSKREEGLQFTMEQNAIPFRVNRNSVLQVSYGGVDDKGGLVNARAQLVLSIDKSKEKEKTYNIALPPTMDSLPVDVNIPIGSLIETTDNDPFELITASSVTWSENTVFFQKFEENIVDGRTATVLHTQQSGPNELQFTIGLTKKRSIYSTVYRSNIHMYLRASDGNGWLWRVLLPASKNWVEYKFQNSGWQLSPYQPNHSDDDPKPSVPTWGVGDDEVTFLAAGVPQSGDFIDIYSLNGMPTTYAVDDGYTMLFNITFYMDAPATVFIGDCTIKDQRLDALPYTPGIIPFSNNSVPNAPTFDAWRGQPYPGYQYPFYYALQTLEENPNRDVMINNVIDFWYDSQQWYNQKFGVLGPGASAYVWDRWDKPDNESPNTWTMYHFGTNVAWSGYQPRAFYASVRMYEFMVEKKLTIPDKLTDYIVNWLSFLETFVSTNGIVPTDFPMDARPEPVQNDFTGHMSGLYLAGISKAWMLGLRINGHLELAHGVYKEIVDNYVQRPGYPDIMNGAWSPFADPANNGKDGMFFGFWAGEIMRGLSLYSEMLDSLN